ncbi:hypothetical protein CC80DRAFT_401956 [Byssothecium circinans]|uniref:Tse2 ADP-ribosyltransferase toxin domain-containing protein n=1 Tax=Byssothecium circinans TaxID=147558 RepID=A0A6A5U8S3_9PLEO|nr:hypothetical protein CC80DRAFT_401956 [Byssothecium circinans]
MSPTLINVFKTVPKELFRVNNGRAVRLREWSLQRQRSYDILTDAGKVSAKALDPKTYRKPNGASMRPNSAFQKRLVSSLKGANTIVYAVPAGVPLPDDLILVHEHTDHYSLQAAKEMTLPELNDKITNFLQFKGRVFSKDQWLQAYPQPTKPSNPPKPTKRNV